MLLYVHKVLGSLGQGMYIDANMTLACFALICKETFFLAIFPLHIHFGR